MPKKAYLAEHLSSEELKDRYRSSQDSVETRRWHLLGQISLGWTIKNAAVAVGLDYQYSFRILKKYNELGEEGVKNLKKKSAEHRRGKERLFVTLYAKSTDKMPRQHTSNPKIPKVSKAIGSPFY